MKVEQDLNLIKDRLIQSFGPNIISIILCGGFGRKEGSFIIRENNLAVPFNDYDLLLVTQQRISKKTLMSLGEKLAHEIGIRFVDLGAIKRASLASLPNTIFTFDLNSSTVIHGDVDVLKEVPKFAPSTMPMKEAHLILFNRIICFLELTPDGFLNKKELTASEHKNLVLQLSKPVIGAAIARLVQTKQYNSSYMKQSDMFFTLDISSQIQNLVKLSYGLKLGLVDPLSVEPWQYWQAARDFFITTFEDIQLVDRSWDQFFSNHKNYRFDIVVNIKNFVKYLFYNEQPSNENMQRETEIMTLLTILSVDKNYTINESLFKKLGNHKDWDEAKKQVTNLWFKYHH